MAYGSPIPASPTGRFGRPGGGLVAERPPPVGGFVPDAILAFQIASLQARGRAGPASLVNSAPEPQAHGAASAVVPLAQSHAAYALPDGVRFGAPRASQVPVSVLGVSPATYVAPPRPAATVVLSSRVTTLTSTPGPRTPPLEARSRSAPTRLPISRSPALATRPARPVPVNRKQPARLLLGAAALTASVGVIGVAVSLASYALYDWSEPSRATSTRVDRPTVQSRAATGVADLGALLRDVLLDVVGNPVELAEVSTESGEMVQVEAGFGVVEIAADGDVDVWIDGGARGVVQQSGHFTLPAGEHVIHVRASGFREQRVVDINDGEAVQLLFENEEQARM